MKYKWGEKDQEILEKFLEKHKDADNLVIDTASGLPQKAVYYFPLCRILHDRENTIKWMINNFKTLITKLS